LDESRSFWALEFAPDLKALPFFRSFLAPGGYVGCGEHAGRRLRAPQPTRASPLFALAENHFEEFERIYDDRYQQQCDRRRPAIGENSTIIPKPLQMSGC
jgi:hypothetical protein